MLLAIDAGNTNIVFALYDGDKMRAQWRAVADWFDILSSDGTCTPAPAAEALLAA